MKKGIIVFLMIAVVAFGAIAQKATLNVLHYIDATQAGYDVDVAIWDKFQADNPDIELVKEELFNEPYHQKVQAYIASGAMPDVFFMWPSGRSAAVHEQKLAKDLKPLLGADFLKAFSAPALDPKQQTGGYLAELPQSFTYTTAMYANTKLLADLKLKVPTTYAQLKALTPKLKAKGIQNIIMANKDTWVMQSCLMSTVAGRMVGNEFVDNVKAGKAKFTDKAWVDALTFIATMYKDGVLSKDTIQIGYGEVPALFAAGKAAFLIDGDWRVGAFLTDKASGVALIDPALQKSDFDIVMFPAIPGEKNKNSISAIAGVGYGIGSSIPAGSDKEKAAVKLVKYLYSLDVQKQRLETGAYIPTRQDVKSDKVEPLTSKLAAYYAKVPKTTYVLDGVLDPKVYEPLNNGLQEMGLGTKTPKQVAEDMQKAFDAWKAGS